MAPLVAAKFQTFITHILTSFQTNEDIFLQCNAT